MKDVIFLHQRKAGKQDFPLRLFAATFVISVLTTAFSGWLLWQQYNRFEEMSRQHIALTGGVGRIMLLDESLTMSARLAAATDDFSYEKKYDQLDPQLTKEINDLRAMLPQKEIKGFVEETDEANVALVKMERRAFALTHQGRRREAMALLAGDEYARFKKVYADGMQRTISATNSLLAGDIQRLHFLSLVSAGLTTAGVLIILATWFFAARSTRHWAMERVESENMLQEAREELEVRVKQRTADLLETNEKLSREIFERELVEAAFRNSEGHLRALVRTIPDIIWLKDKDGLYLSCNSMFERFFGAREADIIGKTDYDFVNEELADSFRQHDREAMAAGKPISKEDWITFADDGHRALMEAIKTPMYDVRGTLIGVLGIGRDITERKQAEEMIRQMAYHDSLTGLPNRKLFADRLGIALVQAKRNQKIVGVAMLDLDNFKNVNDTLGHNVGDLLLKAAAERLSAVLRKGDTVARFGGDEFVLILPDLKATEDTIRVAQKIVDSFCKPFRIDTHQLTVTTSIGIAVYPNDGTDEVMLLKNADIAMYQAKQAGRSRYELYKKA